MIDPSLSDQLTPFQRKFFYNKLLKGSLIFIALTGGYSIFVIGFESFLHYTRNYHTIKMKDYPFKHGVGYNLPSGVTLYGSYHPSPRNVNTKRITFDMMVTFLKKLTISPRNHF